MWKAVRGQPTRIEVLNEPVMVGNRAELLIGIEGKVTVKWSKELNKVLRSKPKNQPEGTAEREKEASKHIMAFGRAMSPDTTLALLVRLMVARIHRQRLIAKALEVAKAAKDGDNVWTVAEELGELAEQIQAEVLKENGDG